MNTFISVFFNTNKAFDYLSNQKEVDVDLKITIIYIVFGLSVATESFFKDRLEDFGLLTLAFIFVFSAGLALILSKYLVSYLLFWIGKFLKGKSQVFEIKTVVAYSLIPILLKLPLIFFLGLTGRYIQLEETNFFILKCLEIIILAFSLKILLTGLIKFNGYGLLKAILNLSLLIILSLPLIHYIFFR